MNNLNRSRTRTADAECARPRARQRSHVRGHREFLDPRRIRQFLRPRTGALRLVAAALLLAAASGALAETHYVDLSSTNATPPYTNWATAASIIQDAVNAAAAGDEVVVTNGTYTRGGDGYSRVFARSLIIRSVNGPEVTTIDGGGQVRCAVLFYGANLSGFTLTHGFASAYYPGGGLGRGGAGVLCVGTNPASIAVISNCVITGNRVFPNLYSGYHLMLGGGVYGGTLNSCKLIDNSVSVSAAIEGGTCIAAGGGVSHCTLNNCFLINNSANATNTDLFFTSGDYAVASGGADRCTLNNCTLTGNSANAVVAIFANANAFAGANGTVNNCISFNNDGAGDSGSPGTQVGNNWFGDPLFVDTNGWANLRLQSNSPCINAGNNAFAPAGPDLDGNPRIAGGTVDIGAYEFQSPVSQISYAWLQQYGLPINSSTDTADPDGDAVDNYHEWLAGTNPANPLSSPAQLTITASGVPPSRIILTWSTNAVGFTLQSTTNLNSPIIWSTQSPGPVVIGAQNFVTNPIISPQQFYRLVH